MSLYLPSTPEQYDASNERERSRLLEQADRENRKKNADVELGEDEKLVIRSPNGTRWSITVANDGTLSATSL